MLTRLMHRTREERDRNIHSDLYWKYFLRKHLSLEYHFLFTLSEHANLYDDISVGTARRVRERRTLSKRLLLFRAAAVRSARFRERDHPGVDIAYGRRREAPRATRSRTIAGGGWGGGAKRNTRVIHLACILSFARSLARSRRRRFARVNTGSEHCYSLYDSLKTISRHFQSIQSRPCGRSVG